MNMSTFATHCRICKKITKKFFDLGRQPLANSLLKRPRQIEKKYPLALNWCDYCSLVQLNYTVDPKKLFSKYVWVTGTSRAAKDFSSDFYKELVKRIPGSRNGYVLEVASNDGTFLLPFAKNGYRVHGVDPATNIVKLAIKNGVPTKTEFWGVKAARKMLYETGSARIVFARNVLAHVANIKDFVSGLSLILASDGVLAIEVHYAGKILKELQYDSIYHEHLCYFTFKPLERLLNEAGLFVFDVMEGPISGGALIIYASKNRRKERAAVKSLRSCEEQGGLYNFKAWQNFAARAFAHRKEFLSMLTKIMKDGTPVVGWGASARSSTLLNFCGIDSKFIPVIADQNKLKQGLFTAGSHIPIKSPEMAMKINPKLVVILGWNFTGEIMKSLKNEFDYHSDCLVPLPTWPRILKL